MLNENERTVAAVYADRLKHGGVTEEEKVAHGEAFAKDQLTLASLIGEFAGKGQGRIEDWRRLIADGVFLKDLVETMLRHHVRSQPPSAVQLVLDYFVRIELIKPGIATEQEAYACSFSSCVPLAVLVTAKMKFAASSLTAGASRRLAVAPYERLLDQLCQLSRFCFPDETAPFEEFSGVYNKNPAPQLSVESWLAEGARHAREDDPRHR